MSIIRQGNAAFFPRSKGIHVFALLLAFYILFSTIAWGAPALISSEPAAGGTMSVGGTVRATFDGDLDPDSVTPASFSLSRVPGIKAISAGDYHSVVLKRDGTVAGWGCTYSGPVVPDGLSGITAIAAGGKHTVALKSDGTVIAWGDNTYGQATVPTGLSDVIAIAAGGDHSVALKGDGTVVSWGANNDGHTTVPEGLSNVIAIAAGRDHTVALKRDGLVVAWGDNSTGQVTVPAGLAGVIAIAAGGTHTVALKGDGTVVAWGDNNFGQASPPEGLTGVKAISAGGYHTLALKQDGTVVAWGNGNNGQTSVPSGLSGGVVIAAGGFHSLLLKDDGTLIGWGDNVYSQSLIPSGLAGVTMVAAGRDHALVLKNDGTVVGWATSGDYGQQIPPAGLADVTGIAAGELHSLAVRKDGTVVAWGHNDYGEATPPTDLTGVTSVAAGYYHSVALKADGTVFSWGGSEATVPAGLSGVTAIAAGYYFTLGLKSDGTVTAWGFNGQGQLNVPVGLSGVKAIAAGGAHALALKTDGTVMAWGDNDNGESTVPAGLTGVVAIAAGGDHSVALKNDGTIVAWGDNQYGQVSVPPTLSGVAAIGAGTYWTLAIKKDGTVVAWGGSSFVPSVLSPYESAVSGATTYETATQTASFTPAPALQEGTVYKVSVTGVRSQAGIPLSAPLSWTFTTEDTTPPITTVSPLGGSYSEPQLLELAANEAATIFYTTDGSQPTINSAVYAAPIPIQQSTQLRFFARDTAGNSEEIRTESYTIIDTIPPVTTASPSGGTFLSQQPVTLSANETASIFYTLDGSDPATSSARVAYTGPFVLNGDTTMKFYAIDLAGNAETVKTEVYSITVQFSSAPDMTYPRARNASVLMHNGKVLVTGGDFGSTPPAEIFDPAANTWTPTGWGGLYRGTATLLPNGKVLVMGGGGPSPEIYDPGYNQWSTAAGNSIERFEHTATMLPNGKILVAGGFSMSSGSLYSAEIYDPISNSWSPAASMNFPHNSHTATALPDGKVLVVGGGAEIYNPQDNTWIIMAPPPFLNWQGHTAVLLDNGSVLVAGGSSPNGTLSSAELYLANENRWVPAGNMSVPRRDHSMALLADGRVLVTGGTSSSYDDGNVLSSAEVYDPWSNTWSPAGSLVTGRATHASVVLPDGKVLLTGGTSGGSALNSAEAFDPRTPPPPTIWAYPGGGIFYSYPTVSLYANPYNWGSIYYTTDGSDPRMSYTRNYYNGPFQITSTTLVRFVASGNNQVQASMYFIADMIPPVTTALPPGGIYATAQSVTLTTNEAATIYFTTDRSEPTPASAIYTGPITIAQDTILTFSAIDTAGNREYPQSQQYRIDTIAPETLPSNRGGVYPTALTVALTTNESAIIYFTVDGSEPTTASAVYGGPMTISATTILKYFAVDVLGNKEVVKTQIYEIGTRGEPGSLWSWGSNNSGQLGDGTTLGKGIPGRIAAMDDTITVAAGGQHALALRSDGTVWSWGNNTFGQLGNGTKENSNVPRPVTGLNNIIAIAAGEDHSLALRADMTVWTWGKNNSGQLGNGSVSSSSVPVQVEGLTDVTAISGGYEHSLALKSDGSVWAWGLNNAGQLGNGSNSSSYTPVQVMTTNKVYSIVAAANHSIALESGGKVVAWGENDYGQLGDGTTTSRNIPGEVNGLNNTPYPVTAIADGFAITNTMYGIMVSSWGIYGTDVGAYQMCNYDDIDPICTIYHYPPKFRVTAETISLTDVREIHNRNGTIAAVKTDGSLWFWYYDTYYAGQLMHKSDPVQMAGISEVKGLAAGTGFILAVKYRPTNDSSAPISMASPAGGSYDLPQLVSLSANEPGTIYYTTDGSEPTTASKVYSGPISISATTTLRYFAMDLAGNREITKTENYLFGPLTLQVSKLGSGNGSVTSTPAGIDLTDSWFAAQAYPLGTTITLNATPGPDSTFIGWQGACSGIGPCTLTINAGTSVGAVFTLASTGNPGPVKVNGAYFALFQDAYNAMATGATLTIEANALDIHENLVFDRDIAVTINGGFDNSFSDNSGMTTIHGTITVTKGVLILDHVIIL